MSKLPLPRVKKIIVIASGKGGVGKTTVTVNLALALQARGAKVGIFDADIYGPNVPFMLGVHRRQEGAGFVAIARGKNSAKPEIAPLERFGLEVMSTGLLVSESQVIDLLSDTVGQMAVQIMMDIDWGDLDYLLLDLPPSSGQPQQALMQRFNIDSAVIVTTPQDMSLLDASRSWTVFEENDVPIVGLVENMSYFICPNCDEHHQLFAESGHPRPEALESVNLLCKIPFSATISQQVNHRHRLLQLGDSEPVDPHSQAFLQLADTLMESVGRD